MFDTITEKATSVDGLLFEICETLQLTPTQHEKAEKRYKAISEVLNGSNSPFSFIKSDVYSQGSMRLGTTVKPIDGPHDLDFVCELAISHLHADPLDLLNKMYGLFKEHGVYGGMVEKKNRCVRIIYKDEFYLDILPACRDHENGGRCVQVPDRDHDDWKPSNPIGYANWFEKATRQVFVTQFAADSRRTLDKAASVQPLPALEATGDKTVLQLVVQLLKRWRDIHYSDSTFPPISIVLTTLAADCYQGEPLISYALLVVLDRIVEKLDDARMMGRRLEVRNPVHKEEDFSERWESNLRAYSEFEKGIRWLSQSWRYIYDQPGNVDKLLEQLFGSVVNTALRSQANAVHSLHASGRLGISRSGAITSLASASVPMRPNTNHGA